MASGGNDNFILEDLQEDSKVLMCKLCSVVFPDAKAKKAHLLGKKHEKKVNEIKLKEIEKKKVNEVKLKEIEKKKAKDKTKYHDSESESENSDEEMYCPECDVFFTGYLSYVSHLKGSRHNKKTKKQNLKKQQENMPEVLNERESDSDENEVFGKTYARCTTCQKEFSGPEAFQMHINSAKHKKKIASEKMLEKTKKDEGKDCNNEEVYGECEICEKTFSGIVPYNIHMKSKVHKKNSEKKVSAEKNKEFFDETEKAFICKECKKPFTDPLAFEHHLENNSHEQRRAKNALMGFLTENPEIVFTTSDSKFSSIHGNDSEEEQYYLVCKVCNVSFSGPESAQDHAKSKKHIGKVTEKKARKILKLKNEVLSEASNSKTSDKKTTKNVSPDEKEANGSENGRKNSIEEFEVI